MPVIFKLEVYFMNSARSINIVHGNQIGNCIVLQEQRSALCKGAEDNKWT